MASRRFAHDRANRPELEHLKTQATLVGGAVATVSLLLALVSLLSRLPLLPALGAMTLVTAGVVAFIAWSVGSRRDAAHVTLWDVAGAFAFIGVAAGILSEPDQVVQLFGLEPTSQ